jgi:uncharacterized protein (DUF1778 family)
MSNREQTPQTRPSGPDEEASTFNARLPRRVKNALQRAADLRGQSLSDFVLGAAYERAVATISAEQVLSLSAADSIRFAEALIEPVVVDTAVLDRFMLAHRKSQDGR